MNKLTEIFQAWVAAANPTPEQKMLAEQRTMVCNSCEYRGFNKTFNVDICGVCDCILSKKVFTPVGAKGCPKKKWLK